MDSSELDQKHPIRVLKLCTTCGADKPLTEFRKQSKNKDGLKYCCKACDDKRNQVRYAQKKYAIIEQVKVWQGANPKKVPAYIKKHREKKHERQSIPLPPSGVPEWKDLGGATQW